ncbi:TetR/AcrR family transcriptional regulator [Xylanimonas oleitrophica]|uniref:TetR/AcrR family transcriptional regulator n=1 Tax=Xylanimonas oleitrophica TaxID=2607479 RepID=A0A2W5WVV6_9MICO|nr:TetR/AcrR family transcriptional regulator [Xylanimonas oleitrophica]PZR55300.1 TetR/AcrR family transcriptional regulator [Xylanimonas oleitrophica]
MADRTALTPAARKVLDAASRLFYEHGLHAVGVDTIAAEAGVTKKTIYDRFGSKDALAVAYLRARDEAWRTLLEETLAARPQPGPERVLALFDAAQAWSGRGMGRGCAAINARAEVADPQHPVALEVARQKAWVRERVRDLCAEAGLARPDTLAGALMLLYDGALAEDGMGTAPAPYATARAAAQTLLGAAGSA